MASTVKIESFDVNVTATSTQTHTLTNTVVLNNAFVRRTTSIDKQSGPTGSTANANPYHCSCAAYLSSTTQISFRQNTTTSQKVRGEVWRFTGSSGDPDEFIVRGRHTITLTATNATGSAAVSGISSNDACIPFWTGSDYDGTSVNDYDSATVAVWIDASGNIQVERGSTTGQLVVYVTVVEFVGANWKVGHAKSTNHDTANEDDITMRTNSLATTGTFDVGDWETAMIAEGSLEGDAGGETGLSDNLGCWVPGTNTDDISYKSMQDASARNDGIAFAHILNHPGFIVKRTTNTNWTEGNGADASVTWPTGASTSESIDELALEWFADTSGTGSAHARGRVSAHITAASGTIQGWVHRSGNNVRIDYGVVDLSAVDGTAYIIITDVDTDEEITNNQTNVVVTGLGGFKATQSTGKVELVENSDYTGTKVEQTSIDSWADTSIQFDAAAGALADTFCYLFVTNSDSDQGYLKVKVGNPPETYTEAIANLTTPPSHHWTFQNTYDDEFGSATANNSSGGTPSFSSTEKIVKGDTHSLELQTGDFISPADQSDMNVTVTANRRVIGGWIMLDSIGQVLSVLFEEGAQVNNIAILNGFGNNLMMQVADTGDHYIQLYMDVSLTADRPYHIVLYFNASGQESGYSKAFLDGVEQSRDNNQPWDVDHMDTHSGNISWGHEGTEQLQVGDSDTTDNVDIAFSSPNACYYSHWFNWTNVTVSDTVIRETLFEKGAVAEETISADTESNMQDDMDLLADTLYTDWPCSIEIAACTAGDFELVMDNITFEDRVSMQIRYLGVDELTLVMENGTVLDTDKLAAPYGGTITVIDAPPITITVKDIDDNSVIQSARVRLLADAGGDLTEGDVILTGLTNASGVITTNLRYTSDQPVIGWVRKATTGTLYKEASISATSTSTGLNVIIFMIKDE